MTELRFLELVHASAISKDRWGWSTHTVGPYTLSTNGIAWTAHKTATRQRVRLQAVLCFAKHGPA